MTRQRAKLALDTLMHCGFNLWCLHHSASVSTCACASRFYDFQRWHKVPVIAKAGDSSLLSAVRVFDKCMAHKRKDTFVKADLRWKHLRPEYKRTLNQRERRAAAKRVRKEAEEV